MSKGLKIALYSGLALVVIVALAIGGGVSSYNSIRNEGITHEQNLNAQFRSNQNELSSYVLTIKESLGVAEAGTDALDQVLTNAVTGRYDGDMEPGSGGEMFSAITEAYPDLTATAETYARVQDAVVSGRNSFKNQQNMLMDKIRVYDTWRDTGLWKSAVVNFAGFPSDRLEVRVGDTVLNGEDALAKMKQMVLDETSNAAFDSGEMEPLIAPQG